MQYSYALLGLAAVAAAQEIEFTSIFNVTATPEQVVNSAGVPTFGPAGALGQFNYAIDSKNDVICYDITLVNFVGAYMSPAKTATHLHEGAKGKAGPPRIAFPNPVGDDTLRHASGCLIGPFTTGLKMADNVTDTGAGFRVSQIEANPAGFFTDSHSVLFLAGVVRGQLDQKFEILTKPEPYPGVPAPGSGYPVDPAPVYPVDPAPVYPVDPAPVYPVDPAPYPVEPYPVYPVETHPVYPVETHPVYPVETHPVYPAETHPVYPAETHPVYPAETYPAGPVVTIQTYPVGKPTPVTTYKPMGTGVTPPYATFTGAAASNSVGGLLIAAGLFAALL